MCKEAARALCNIGKQALPEQVLRLAQDHNYLETIKTMLESPQEIIVRLALGVTSNILDSRFSDMYVQMLISNGMVEQIKGLERSGIKSLVEKILQHFSTRAVESSSAMDLEHPIDINQEDVEKIVIDDGVNDKWDEEVEVVIESYSSDEAEESGTNIVDTEQ